MSKIVDIQVDTTGNADAAVRGVLAQIQNRRPLMAQVGGALTNRIKDHFTKKNDEPNQHNWPKRNFYNREGRNKTALTEVTETSAQISIASPAIAHRYKGGTIEPVRGDYLAIPLTARAYVKGSPREWDNQDDLEAIRFGGSKGKIGPGGLFLVTKDAKGKLTVQYLLVKSVTHDPDPSVFPTDAEFQAVVSQSVTSYAERILRRRAAAATKP